MSSRAAQIAGHLNYPKGLLSGQVAIITGSGQGIGAEAARLFANEGAKVVVSDIDAGKSSQVPLRSCLLTLLKRRQMALQKASIKMAEVQSLWLETCSIPSISRHW
jgi:NAD(P)-dependent dehydrogenase (short-subunit alcohol dehydrogenase family)